ncbi:hypothetical protein GUJ93_ZPchr0011g27300 [Zizania palustris]|uniref:Uncharacterized protein n=1 Tax=Zizania palustris TaxID=103762 RepID=A0A8J5WMC2_ZIZPA|nr:hypothetical protein GUJ93_ZPchr0011g27300 [Zizania palustris]
MQMELEQLEQQGNDPNVFGTGYPTGGDAPFPRGTHDSEAGGSSSQPQVPPSTFAFPGWDDFLRQQQDFYSSFNSFVDTQAKRHEDYTSWNNASRTNVNTHFGHVYSHEQHTYDMVKELHDSQDILNREFSFFSEAQSPYNLDALYWKNNLQESLMAQEEEYQERYDAQQQSIHELSNTVNVLGDAIFQSTQRESLEASNWRNLPNPSFHANPAPKKGLKNFLKSMFKSRIPPKAPSPQPVDQGTRWQPPPHSDFASHEVLEDEQ